MSSSKKEEDIDDPKDKIKNNIKSFGHIYAVSLLCIFTIYTRMQGYTDLKDGDGGWLFLGNDSWYHVRATRYTVENFPSLLEFDAYTGYPEGSLPGAFGTLYNFVHGLIALILGLGDPSAETIEMVLVFSSPVISAVGVVLVYYATRKITESRLAGVSASFILAFSPSMFYNRGVAGFAQHHIAESVLLIVSVLLVMKAVQYAEDNYIIKEVLRERNSEVYDWMKITGLAIVGIFVYYITWPPAMMIFGLIAISAVIYSLIGFFNDRSRSALLTLTVISGSTIFMVLVTDPVESMTVANSSYLHLGVAVVSFLISFFVWSASIVAEERNWNFKKFFLAIIGTGILLFIISILLQPDLVNRILDQIARIFGFGSDSTATIGEERVPDIENLGKQQYGLMLPTAIFGLGVIVHKMVKQNLNSNGFSGKTFFLIVSIFIMLISFRTIRFNYYLGPFIAILASIAIYEMVKIVGIPDTIGNVKGYHILALMLVVTLFVPVLLVSVDQPTVFEQDTLQNPGYEQWEESLEWMSENTEDPNLGTYETNTKPFTYPDGSYGVMSWWDYGHWITYTGDRIPVANPFQQNAQLASEYLLADDPNEAEELIRNEGNESSQENANVRYIAIDWQMASPLSKLGAIQEFHPELEPGDFSESYFSSRPGQSPRIQFTRLNQNYYESMLGRLFVGHGGAMEPSNRTINYNAQQGFKSIQPSINPIVEHNTTQEARSFAQNNVEVTRGGLIQPKERVEALENYRLVKSSPSRLFTTREYGFQELNIRESMEENPAFGFTNENPSTVKIFEKVKGAKVSGNGFNESTELTLKVDLIDPSAENASTRFSFQPEEFTYKQNVETSSGKFSTVVPYSTEGYEEVENAPQVRASSEYKIVDKNGSVVSSFEVSEKAVINGGNITVSSSN